MFPKVLASCFHQQACPKRDQKGEKRLCLGTMGLVQGPGRRQECCTPQVKKRIGSYPYVRVEGGGRGVVSQAGGVLLVEMVRKTGLDQAISAALTPWRSSGWFMIRGRSWWM